MKNFLRSITSIQKQLLILAAVILLGGNSGEVWAKGWTAQKAAQYVPVIGAKGYYLNGRYINGEVTSAQQELLILSVSLQTGVDKDSLRQEVERRNNLFVKGKLSDRDVLDLRPAQSESVVLGQAAGGGSGGAAGAAQEGDAEDSNKVGAFGIRQRYFERYPYALAAFRADIKVPVDGGGSQGGGAGAGGAGGAGGVASILSGLLSSEGSGPQGPVNLQRSLGTKFDQNSLQTKEGQQAQVVAYNFVIKFCNDNPANGICYFQPLLIATDVPATYRDLELFQTAMTGVHGMPLSDTQFQILDRENKQRFLELLFDPERFMWLSTNTGQMQGASAANSLAGAGETSFNNAFDKVTGGGASGGSGGGSGGGVGSAGKGLINVANDSPMAFGGSQNPHKSKREAVYMVQQMYKFVFLPMAILFLLPGAVLTQTKGYVSRGILSNSGPDEMASPFDGILRSIIAIFLIPATQLIVSYSIDIGNSLADSVKPWINKTLIIDVWSTKQTYNPPVGNVDNVIQAPTPRNLTSGLGSGIPGVSGGGGSGGGGGGGGFSVNIPGLPAGVNSAIGAAFNRAAANLISSSGLGGLLSGALSPTTFGAGGQGKAAQIDESQTIQESQLWLSQVMQFVFNFVLYAFSFMLIVLTAYQLVFMCYLYLLGPLCASFWAWPKITDKMFRNIFGNWLNSVITLSLWRFYWCVILAIMTVRLEVLFESGGFNVNAQYELMVFCCFLGLMLYVPFVPFDFNPGAAAESVLQRGSQMGQTIAQGAAGMAKEAGVPESTIQQGMQQVNQATGNMTAFAQGMASGNVYDGLTRSGDGVGADGSLGRGQGTGQGSGPSGERPGGTPLTAPPPGSAASAPAPAGTTSPVASTGGGEVPGSDNGPTGGTGSTGGPAPLAPSGEGAGNVQPNAGVFNSSNVSSPQAQKMLGAFNGAIDKLVGGGMISAAQGTSFKAAAAAALTAPAPPTTGTSPAVPPPTAPPSAPPLGPTPPPGTGSDDDKPPPGRR